MIPVVCLLLYAIAVAVVGPLILARLTAAGIAPRLGVAAWLSAMAGVFVAAAAAVAIALVALGRSGDAARGIVDCFGVLSTSVGEFSGAGMRLLSGTMLSAGTVVGAIGTWRICRGVRRRRARAHEHARLARMIGRRIPALDAVVIDSDEPVAYCIAGRERSVVITRGTLSVLASWLTSEPISTVATRWYSMSFTVRQRRCPGFPCFESAPPRSDTCSRCVPTTWQSEDREGAPYSAVCLLWVGIRSRKGHSGPAVRSPPAPLAWSARLRRSFASASPPSSGPPSSLSLQFR